MGASLTAALAREKGLLLALRLPGRYVPEGRRRDRGRWAGGDFLRTLLERHRVAGSAIIHALTGPLGALDRELCGRVDDILPSIRSGVSPRDVLRQVLDVAVDMVQAERAFLLVLDHGEERILASRNCDREDLLNPEAKLSRAITSVCMRSGEAIVITNAQEDSRFLQEPSVRSLRLRSILCTPVRIRRKIAGAVYLDNRFRPFAFGQREIELIDGLTRLVALAIRRDNAHRESRQPRPESRWDGCIPQVPTLPEHPRPTIAARA